MIACASEVRTGFPSILVYREAILSTPGTGVLLPRQKRPLGPVNIPPVGPRCFTGVIFLPVIPKTPGCLQDSLPLGIFIFVGTEQVKWNGNFLSGPVFLFAFVVFVLPDTRWLR